MVQVYSNTDFALYLPYYLAGIDFGENSTLKIFLYTINRDVSYSVTIPANPIPVYINIEGKELSFMESGVIRCLLTLSQPNVEFSDGVCDKTFVFTTDMFYNRPAANVVFENYYTKSETQQIIDELEATIASEYPDSIEMETFVTENTSTFIKESSVPGAACQIVNFKQNNIGGSFVVDVIQQNNLWNKAVEAFKKGKTIVFRCTKYGDNYTFYQGMPQVYYADNSYTVSKFVCTIMDSKNSSFTITWSYNGSGYLTTTDFTNYQTT